MREEEYNIYPPDKVEYVPRDEFVQSLISLHSPKAKAAEDAILSIWDDQQHRRPVLCKVDPATVTLARDYIRYRDQGARLPKFSRWATGMFRDNKQLASDLATAGKYQESSGEIVISGDKIDILRCADTPHFSSCFKYRAEYPLGDYTQLPKLICEKTPGICIAYVDDENKRMRGRVWVHHARRQDNGKDVAVVCQAWAGSLPAKQVAEVINSMGIEALVGEGYGREVKSKNAVLVDFINCFDTQVHHDMYTWRKGFSVEPV